MTKRRTATPKKTETEENVEALSEAINAGGINADDVSLGDKSPSVKLTHEHPCNMRGVVTLAQYKPDVDGVIEVDVRDAPTLRKRFGWRDVDS